VVVSVVTPTYNSAAFLPWTLESVRRQTFSDWEMILVDDGSTDDTVKIAEEAARSDRRIRVVRAAHEGVARARNRGLAEISPEAEFVTFLDSDDTYEPEALTTLLEALRRHPELPAAHGLARAVDVHGKQFEGDTQAQTIRDRFRLQRGKLVPLPASAPTSFEALLVHNHVVTPGLSLIRTRVLAALGGFDPATDPADDWDMNLRIGRQGGYALVDRVILNWRRHPSSISHARKIFWPWLEVLKRAIRFPGNTGAQRAAATAALLGFSRKLYNDAFAELTARRLVGWASAMFKASVCRWHYLRARARQLLGGGDPRAARLGGVREGTADAEEAPRARGGSSR